MKEIKHYPRWSIEKSAQIYEEVLGADWIRQQLTQRDAIFLEDKFARANYYLENHPIIAFWPWNANDSWRETKGMVVPQPLPYFFNTPAFHIQLAMHLSGFDKRCVPSRIRNRTDFNSFAFECKIASSFYLCGYNVEFFPESFRPTPDLVVSSKGGKVYAECKLREFTKQWREYEVRAAISTLALFHLMEQTRTNLTVSVESPDAVENLDVRRLALGLTTDLALKSHTGSFTVDSCRISWSNNGGFGLEQDGVFPYNIPDAQPQFNGTESGFKDGKPFFRNPRFVSFSTTKLIDRVTPLQNIFLSSLRQTEKYPPSVVYLELEPGSFGQVEKSGIDNRVYDLFDPTKQGYDERTSAVKFLIFTSIWYELENGTWTRYSKGHMIDNSHSVANFPAGFLRGGKYFPGNANADKIAEEIQAMIDRGDLDGTLDLFEFGLAHSPDQRLFDLRAHVFNTLGRFSAALDASSDAIKIEPRDAKAWVNRAISFVGLKKLHQALDSIAHALGINPNDVDAWCLKGEIHFRMGRRSEARQCLEVAQGLDSDSTRVRDLAKLLNV
jgi:hypothetical protein